MPRQDIFLPLIHTVWHVMYYPQGKGYGGEVIQQGKQMAFDRFNAIDYGWMSA